MRDLLSTVYRCDLCGTEKEQREFAIVADGENEVSVCKGCEMDAAVLV